MMESVIGRFRISLMVVSFRSVALRLSLLFLILLSMSNVIQLVESAKSSRNISHNSSHNGTTAKQNTYEMYYVDSNKVPIGTGTNRWQMLGGNTTTTLDSSSRFGYSNYQIVTFMIDQNEDELRQINMVTQTDEIELGEVIQDMRQCGNWVFTANSFRISIGPLNKDKFNLMGLYEPKVLLEVTSDVLNERKSIAYDWVSQSVFFSKEFNIEAIDLCEITSSPTKVITRDETTQITQLSVDSIRNLLIWFESDDVRHFRIMMSDTSGEYIVQLHESTKSQCTAMTIDTEHSIVYWVEMSQLWQLSYQPIDKGTIVFEHPDLITDRIQVDRLWLYWISDKNRVLAMKITNDSAIRAEQPIIYQINNELNINLVSFYVSTTLSANHHAIDHCLPSQCNRTLKQLVDKNFIEHPITTALIWSVWTAIKQFEWTSPRLIAQIVVTSSVVLTINIVFILLFHCTVYRTLRSRLCRECKYHP